MIVSVIFDSFLVTMQNQERPALLFSILKLMEVIMLAIFTLAVLSLHESHKLIKAFTQSKTLQANIA